MSTNLHQKSNTYAVIVANCSKNYKIEIHPKNIKVTEAP